MATDVAEPPRVAEVAAQALPQQPSAWAVSGVAEAAALAARAVGVAAASAALGAVVAEAAAALAAEVEAARAPGPGAVARV